MYPNFRFDSIYDNAKNNNNYIDEIVLEPIEIETNPRQNFGYRVYSKIKENNEKEGIVKINEIYYYRNPYDESYAAFLVKESHWDKWIKINRNDKIVVINFKDSPYFAGKEYLKENYLENGVNHKLVKDNKSKVVERER